MDNPHAARLFDLVEQDPELRATWERYHLIGQALRGEPIAPEARQVAAAVRAALAAEPALMIPRTRKIPRVASVAPFAGAALAAGAAFLAVFVVPGLLPSPASDRLALGGQRAVALAPTAYPVERRWDIDRAEVANKLDVFLLTHQEAAPATGVRGMLPYGTLVGYAPGR